MPEPTPLRKSRFRFSLRTFLLVIAGVCALLAATVTPRVQAHRAIHALESQLEVHYHFAEPRDWLDRLLGLRTHAERVSLNGLNLRPDDHALAALGQVHGLKAIYLGHRAMSLENLQAIPKLPGVREFVLSDSDGFIDSEEYRELFEKLPNLEVLRFSGCRHVNDDVVRLVHGDHIRELQVRNCELVRGHFFDDPRAWPVLDMVVLSDFTITPQVIDMLAQRRALRIVHLWTQESWKLVYDFRVLARNNPDLENVALNFFPMSAQTLGELKREFPHVEWNADVRE